jgi:hypothetical protein
MSWWRISDIDSGGIDFTHKCPTNPELSNAIPNIDSSDELYNGDTPADIMGDALDKISKEYKRAWDRTPKREELQAVFNFVLNGIYGVNPLK